MFFTGGSPYEKALLDSSYLALQSSCGLVIDLPVGRYLSAPTTVDLFIASKLQGSVLDVGCGPGRIVEALNRTRFSKGVNKPDSMGVDLSEAAVSLALKRGVEAFFGDVFEPVLHEGLWDGVTIFDGNIALNGNPSALLERCTSIIKPSGGLLIELNSGILSEDRQLKVRFKTRHGLIGPEFLWYLLGFSALQNHAKKHGFSMRGFWKCGLRSFALLAL